MPLMSKHVQAYTDGSCNTTTGDGGWAFLIKDQGYQKTASGYEANTTNNRMELTAAVQALSVLGKHCIVTLVTDSEYLKRAFTDGWVESWQKNGWRTAKRQPVKNQDLWRKLVEFARFHQITWSWVRGHTGHPANEQVDKLALEARKRGVL
jgi:ribonuclease HI